MKKRKMTNIAGKFCPVPFSERNVIEEVDAQLPIGSGQGLEGRGHLWESIKKRSCFLWSQSRAAIQCKLTPAMPDFLHSWRGYRKWPYKSQGPLPPQVPSTNLIPIIECRVKSLLALRLKYCKLVLIINSILDTHSQYICISNHYVVCFKYFRVLSVTPLQNRVGKVGNLKSISKKKK